MKWKRSERLVDMTHYLLEHPQQLIPLTFFAESYQSAKSSISEDLSIVKDTFEERGIGHLITVPGAAGGVKYIPKVPEESAKKVITELIKYINFITHLQQQSFYTLHTYPLCIRIPQRTYPHIPYNT